MNHTVNRWLRLCYGLILATPLIPLTGCAFSPNPTIRQYTTIAADPNRDTNTAHKHHEQALKIIERAAVPMFYECNCLSRSLCDVHKAEQLLNDALVADVRFGPAHNTLGLLYYHQRKYYLAAWEFEYASNLMPNRAEPLNNLGMVYEDVGQIEQAIEIYAMATEIAPGNPIYLGNFARAHLRSGQDLSSIQGLLQQLILMDTRPEWIAWAEDQLGIPSDPFRHIEVGEKTEMLEDPVIQPSANPSEELPVPSPAVVSN